VHFHFACDYQIAKERFEVKITGQEEGFVDVYFDSSWKKNKHCFGADL
jgi:hypothetical protein